MRWLRRWWRRLWGFRHEPHRVNDGTEAATARVEQERKLRQAQREAAQRRPEVKRAGDTFTAAVEQAFGWRHR